jgi:hypothetical protein
MTAKWTIEQLEVLGGAGEIDITPGRGDGTYGTPTTIWIVRVGDDLYVRSYRGAGGAWFQRATHTNQGQIRVDGSVYAVDLDVDPDVDHLAVDAAYGAKYGRSSYADAMVTDTAAATTLRLTPTSGSEEDR